MFSCKAFVLNEAYPPHPPVRVAEHVSLIGMQTNISCCQAATPYLHKKIKERISLVR